MGAHLGAREGRSRMLQKAEKTATNVGAHALDNLELGVIRKFLQKAEFIFLAPRRVLVPEQVGVAS